jgi:hypothetical protein
MGGSMFCEKTLLITGKFGNAALHRFSEIENKEIDIFSPAIKSRSEK